jgi:GTP-binding protein Era
VSTRPPHRAGFVALVGRPNVGKSTLLNALVERKLSIVTPKPQTTRHRILGLLHRPDFQIALVDTPGIHAGGKRMLNVVMNRTAAASLADADLIAFVVEALRFTSEDERVLERIRESGRPAVLVVNKADRARPRERLLPFIAALAARHPFVEVVPLSALKHDNVSALPQALAKHLPESPPLFPPEQITDRSERFRAAEIIREKLTLRLRQELPYGTTVEIENIESTPDGRVAIHAVIWVEREGHKAIVIGAKGEALKRIATAARLDMEKLFGGKVHLEVWVKVRRGWTDDDRQLQRFGHGSEP